MIFNLAYSNNARPLVTWIYIADKIVLACFIGAISNTAINISQLIGAWLSSRKLRPASDGRARRFMIPFIEVQWWSIRSQRRFAAQFELHGGQKITHLTYPPFFPLLRLLQDTPSYLEWTTIRRRGTRYLSPADNVKILEARASFFQMEFRQASLIYEPARAHQVTIKHSMSGYTAMKEIQRDKRQWSNAINVFVSFDLYRKEIDVLSRKQRYFKITLFSL